MKPVHGKKYLTLHSLRPLPAMSNLVRTMVVKNVDLNIYDGDVVVPRNPDQGWSAYAQYEYMSENLDTLGQALIFLWIKYEQARED